MLGPFNGLVNGFPRREASPVQWCKAGQAFSEMWVWTETMGKPVPLAGAKASKLRTAATDLGEGQEQGAGRRGKGEGWKRTAASSSGWARIPTGDKGQVCTSWKLRQLDQWTWRP